MERKDNNQEYGQNSHLKIDRKSNLSNSLRDKYRYNLENSTTSTNGNEIDIHIDPERNRYPYCIVWTPLPLITWLLPFIGHMGICTSEGVIHDFAGPYYVSVDDMAFGNPTKYMKLELTSSELSYFDRAIDSSTNKYNSMEYSFFCNNCHSYVADCLNKLKYKGKNNYGIISVWWMVTVGTKYVSFGNFMKTYCGFAILLGLALFIWMLAK